MPACQKLPFDPQKIETINVLKAESRTSRVLAELKGLANVIPNQSIIANTALMKESQDSSEIENIITTQDDLYTATYANATEVDSATKEVMFYKEAIDAGLEALKDHSFISINDIVKIQKVLVKNDAGIRTMPGTQLVNDHTKEVVYIPPQTKEEIDDLLKNFTEYLNNDDDSLAKMAVLHY